MTYSAQTTQDRLRFIERQLDEILTVGSTLEGKVPSKQYVRIVQTKKHENDAINYPATGLRLPFRFTDGRFNDTGVAPSSSITFKYGSEWARATGFCLSGWRPEGTILIATRSGQKWFLTDPVPPEGTITFVAVASDAFDCTETFVDDSAFDWVNATYLMGAPIDFLHVDASSVTNANPANLGFEGGVVLLTITKTSSTSYNTVIWNVQHQSISQTLGTRYRDGGSEKFLEVFNADMCVPKFAGDMGDVGDWTELFTTTVEPLVTYLDNLDTDCGVVEHHFNASVIDPTDYDQENIVLDGCEPTPEELCVAVAACINNDDTLICDAVADCINNDDTLICEAVKECIDADPTGILCENLVECCPDPAPEVANKKYVQYSMLF